MSEYNNYPSEAEQTNSDATALVAGIATLILVILGSCANKPYNRNEINKDKEKHNAQVENVQSIPMALHANRALTR